MKYLGLLMTTAFMFIFLLHSPVSHADGPTTYKVNTDSLNVRSAPSREAAIIGNLSAGDQLTAFQESFGWVQTYYGGETAWVASHFLSPVNSGGVTAADEQITVTATEVRLRTGPGVQYEIIGYTTNGDSYYLLETKNGWHHISLNDGTDAWIAGWLTDEKTTTKTTNNADEKDQEQDGSLSGYNIVVDPGHGGKDPGAIGIGGVYEKDLVMQTARQVIKQMREAGATVITTRNQDYFVTLGDRVRISRSYNTHAFISLHYNAYPLFGVNGVSTHFDDSSSDIVLAREIQSSLADHLSLADRGIMQDDYHVLEHTSAPSVLVELGFITNSYDLAAIQSGNYHSKAAAAIVDGLEDYLK